MPGGRDLTEGIYAAFAAKDGTAMAARYAPDARFRDPVFAEVRGAEGGAMWRMLTGSPTGLTAEPAADDARGWARWQARYTFWRPVRPVVSDVRASPGSRGGLIAGHRGEFSFCRWARQALRPAGLMPGRTALARSRMRRGARAAPGQFLAPGSHAA